MHLRLVPLGGAALAAALLFAGCSPRDDETAAGPLATPAAAATAAAAAPDARVPDLPTLGDAPRWQLKRLDGSTFDSAELAGKVAVIDFWATWCGPCRVEIPGYVEMQEQYEQDGLVIVGVSLDQQGPEVVRKFSEQYGINYPLVMGDSDILEAFGGVQAIPTTFLIDREGKIRHRKVGAMEREEYEPLVTSLL